FVVAVGLAVAQVWPQVKARTLMLVLAWSAGAACLVGLYQFVGGLVGLPLNVTGLRSDYSGQVFGFPRVESTALEPLYFSAYMLLAISMLIGVGAVLKRSWLLGVLFVTSVLLTLSRGGVGAMIVVATAWIIWMAPVRRNWRRIAGIVGVAAAGVLA